MHNLNRWAAGAMAVMLAFVFYLGMFCNAMPSFAEETASNNLYTIDMEYLSDQQALRVSQRLVYINRNDVHLNSVTFYAAANMFRRESALMYESDDLESVFYAGYAPGGIDIQDIRFNGEDVSWGMQGKDETALRVSCNIAPGDSGIFEFEYYILLTECGAFIGAGENDIRLSAFYFAPGQYNQSYSEFNVNEMLPFTRWLHSDAADFSVTIRIPSNCDIAASGTEKCIEIDDKTALWQITAENVREFAVSFGKRYRIETDQADNDVEIRVFSNDRSSKALRIAKEAVDVCESWFGRFPVRQLDIVQSDYPLGSLNYPGVIWISSDLFENGKSDHLEKQIRFCIAQQYFGFSAYTAPSSDAWMSDAVCEYLSYLMIEELDGRNAFLKSINSDWVDSLQLTIPGGLTVTSDAGLFDEKEYEIVVRRRGAVVMHELRNAMGREEMLAGLKHFYEMGKDGHTLSELELVDAFDTVSGGSWESFLTDWVFNVGDYVNQNIDWFE